MGAEADHVPGTDEGLGPDGLGVRDHGLEGEQVGMDVGDEGDAQKASSNRIMSSSRIYAFPFDGASQWAKV
jgi:hypothetical protein